MNKTKTLFWKSDGGYLRAVKLGGRWYYVGSSGAEGIAFHAYMKDNGYQLERAQGMPSALAKIWIDNGATYKALKNNLPFWEDYFERRKGR